MRPGLAAGLGAVLLAVFSLSGAGAPTIADTSAKAGPTRTPPPAATDVMERLRELAGLQAQAKPPGYRGDDSCVFANDGECDDIGLGTGACAAGTDYSDCRRIAAGVEDNSCQWANDGECDEPHFGTGACSQATDLADCGSLNTLRFRDDSCIHAFNDVCDEPGSGNNRCQTGTDRSDCVGRERPMQIFDHYFGFDDRIVFDTSVFPWSVIGMVRTVDDGVCTATLVAANVIATAAHCIETDSGGIDARATFETAFGGPGGFRSARVTAYLVDDSRVATGSLRDDSSDTDWALLRLDRPLGADLGFVGVRQLSASSSTPDLLFQAGYSWDSGDNLSGNLGCSVVNIEPANRVRHDCDTTHGDSGSPIMVREGDSYFLVATDSEFDFGEDGGPPTNLATRSDVWSPLLAEFAAGRIGVDVGAAKGLK